MRRFDLEGLCQSLNSLLTDKDPRSRNVSLQFSLLATYVIAQQHPVQFNAVAVASTTSFK